MDCSPPFAATHFHTQHSSCTAYIFVNVSNAPLIPRCSGNTGEWRQAGFHYRAHRTFFFCQVDVSIVSISVFAGSDIFTCPPQQCLVRSCCSATHLQNASILRNWTSVPIKQHLSIPPPSALATPLLHFVSLYPRLQVPQTNGCIRCFSLCDLFPLAQCPRGSSML